MHQSWCRRVDAQELMNQSWCTRVDALEHMHLRWGTGADSPGHGGQGQCGVSSSNSRTFLELRTSIFFHYHHHKGKKFENFLKIQNNFKICQKSIRKKRQKRLFGQRVFHQWSNIASIMLSFCHTKYSLYNIWHKNIPFTIFETKKVQVYFIYFCCYNVWLFCLRHKRKWNRTKSRPKNVCYL